MTSVIPITWNANDIAAGVRDIRGKWVNSPYLRNGAVEWNPLTPAFLNDGSQWQSGESPVIVAAPRLATQPIRFVNGVSWDVHRSTAIAAAQNELLVSHPGASPVEGIVIEGRESQVLYRNAITDGIDIAVGVWHGRGPRAEHIYVIRRMPSGDSEFVEIDSHVTAIGSRVAGWDGASLLTIGNTSIVDRQDDRRGWTLRPAVAWYYDAAGNMVSTPIVARMQLLSRGNVKVTKFVPRSLIATALAARENGELRCDLTGTFYPDANPETTTVDGYIERFDTVGPVWAVYRAQTTGTTANDSATSAGIRCVIETDSVTSTWDRLSRGYTGFDLTSLSGTTVSAGTYSLSGTSTSEILSGQSINITTATIASNTAVSTGDLGALGTSTTSLASDYAISSVVAATYNDMAMNSSGVTAIQSAVGGILGIALKIASDINNAEPTWAANSDAFATFYATEQTGTSRDPKLVVTYTTGGGSIAAIANHYARMRSN